MSSQSNHPTRLSHYDLEAELGRGGMGIVYRARDSVLGRALALKVIKPADYAGPGDIERLRARFRREAQLAAGLNHPNLVTVYAFEETGDLALIAMELVVGETVSQLIARGQRWTPEAAARLLMQVADGVSTAHAAGIVHRDLKPANIMLQPDGRARVLDFGVAKGGNHGEAVTVAGTVFGTVNYMAPEQVLGREVGPAADVFALGAIGYELVTGERAFSDGNPVTVAMHVVSGEPEHLRSPDIATRRFGRLAHVLRRALSKNVARRHAGAKELRDALREFLAGKTAALAADDWSGSHPTLSLATGTSAHRSRDRRVAALVLAFVLTITVVGAGSVFYLSRGVPARAAPGPAGTAPRPDTPSLAPGPAPSATPASARIRAYLHATPAGSRITTAILPGREWTDSAEFELVDGDSLPVRVERSGYVSQDAWFLGRPMQVTLLPDSVTVVFASNTRVSVFVARQSDAFRPMGFASSAPLRVRLEAGRYRIAFRAPFQADWVEDRSFAPSSSSYQVTKLDYVTQGDLRVATVAPSWACVAVDAGRPEETPKRFTGLNVGAHSVTVWRPGYRTVTDSVTIMPGRETARQYVLEADPGRSSDAPAACASP